MHPGEQTGTTEPQLGDRPGHPFRGRLPRRVHHEEADKASRMPVHGCRHRLFVFRDAGDDRRPADLVAIQLRNPTVRQLPAGAGRIPCQDSAGVAHGVVPPDSSFTSQRPDKVPGEEMAMRVIRFHGTSLLRNRGNRKEKRGKNEDRRVVSAQRARQGRWPRRGRGSRMNAIRVSPTRPPDRAGGGAFLSITGSESGPRRHCPIHP